MSVDRLLDRIAGKIVRESVFGSGSTNMSSGTKSTRQLESRGISCERSQTGICT